MATAATMASGGREMALGSVLSRAFAAIGAVPGRFVGIGVVLVALPSLASQLIAAAATPRPAAGENPLAVLWPAMAVSGIVWWLLWMAAQAMLFRATVGVLDGARDEVRVDAGAAARRLLPLAGLAIVLTVSVWFGFVLLVVPGVVLATMWSVAAPALVVEDVGVFGSLGRSRRLTKGARWRILALVLLVFAIYFVAAAALGLGSLAATGFGETRVFRPEVSIPGTIASLVLQTGLVIVWSAIQAALYVELRDWKDGHSGDRLADIFA